MGHLVSLKYDLSIAGNAQWCRQDLMRRGARTEMLTLRRRLREEYG